MLSRKTAGQSSSYSSLNKETYKIPKVSTRCDLFAIAASRIDDGKNGR